MVRRSSLHKGQGAIAAPVCDQVAPRDQRPLVVSNLSCTTFRRWASAAIAAALSAGDCC